MDSSPIVQMLAQAAAPWQAAYSASTTISVTVVFIHLAALLIGGGLAITTDRTTLRASWSDPRARERVLQDMRGAHGVVIGAIVMLWVSGVLLAASDVETFAASPWFWVKIALVTVLMLNGFVLYRTGRALHRSTSQGHLVRRLRISAVASVVLWCATVLVGTVLQIAA
jgi:uncharacterized membrane protein